MTETLQAALRDLAKRRDYLVMFGRDVGGGQLRVRRTPPLTLWEALDQIRAAKAQAGLGLVSELYPVSVALLAVPELQVQVKSLD